MRVKLVDGCVTVKCHTDYFAEQVKSLDGYNGWTQWMDTTDRYNGWTQYGSIQWMDAVWMDTMDGHSG